MPIGQIFAEDIADQPSKGILAVRIVSPLSQETSPGKLPRINIRVPVLIALGSCPRIPTYALPYAGVWILIFDVVV